MNSSLNHSRLTGSPPWEVGITTWDERTAWVGSKTILEPCSPHFVESHNMISGTDCHDLIYILIILTWTVRRIFIELHIARKTPKTHLRNPRVENGDFYGSKSVQELEIHTLVYVCMVAACLMVLATIGTVIVSVVRQGRQGRQGLAVTSSDAL